MAEAIGRMKCPICSSKRARVSVSTKGRCCITCNACHFQGFARSDYSDTLIRSVMTPEAAARVADEAAPKPPEPAPGMEIAPKLEGVKVEPKAAPRKARAPAAVAPKAEPEPVAPKVEPAPPAVVEKPAAKPRNKWDFF